MIHVDPGADYPAPDRRVKRWFRARLAVLLNQQTDAVARRVQDDPELWAAVRDTYVEDIERYLFWRPADACLGRGYAEGEHRLDTDLILQDLPEIVGECTEDLGLTPVMEASPPPKPAVQPIPDGPIDIEAALEALQRPDRQAPHDKGVWYRLDDDQRDRHMTLIRKVRRKMPKLCRHCGGEFLPKLDSEASCPTCKKARRGKCIRCGEQTTAGNARAKRCDRCLGEGGAKLTTNHQNGEDDDQECDGRDPAGGSRSG